MDAVDRALRDRLLRAAEDMAAHPVHVQAHSAGIAVSRRNLRPLVAALAFAAGIAVAASAVGLHARFAGQDAPASRPRPHPQPTSAMLQQGVQSAIAFAHGGRGPSGGAAAMAEWDSTHGSLVLVVPGDANHGPGQTWTWNGSWRQEGAPPPDDVVYGAAIVNMPLLHGVVTFGGTDVWLWDGSAWVSQGPLPFGSGYAGYATTGAYDPARHELVVLAYDPDVNGVAPHDGLPAQTWTWDGHTWRHRAGAPDLQPFGQAATWDADTRQVVIAGTASDGRAAAWSYTGTAWKRFGTSAGSAFPAAAAGLAWDPKVHAMVTLLDTNDAFEVAGGSAAPGTTPARVVRLTASGWSAVVPLAHPADTVAQLVTDTDHNRVLAVGLAPVPSTQERRIPGGSDAYVVMEWTEQTWRVVSS